MKCTEIHPDLSAYLDDALEDRALREVRMHLSDCDECNRKLQALERTQSLVAALGRRPAPAELALQIRVALSQREKITFQRRMQGLAVRLENSVNSFMLPATGGLLTAVVMFGLFVGFFAGPPPVAIGDDVPTVLYMPPRLSGSPFAMNTDGPVVIEAFVDSNGRLEDYRILSGEDNAQVRRQLDRSLIFAVFEPAMSFGKPAPGTVVVAFSNVNVKG